MLVTVMTGDFREWDIAIPEDFRNARNSYSLTPEAKAYLEREMSGVTENWEITAVDHCWFNPSPY